MYLKRDFNKINKNKGNNSKEKSTIDKAVELENIGCKKLGRVKLPSGKECIVFFSETLKKPIIMATKASGRAFDEISYHVANVARDIKKHVDKLLLRGTMSADEMHFAMHEYCSKKDLISEQEPTIAKDCVDAKPAIEKEQDK